MRRRDEILNAVYEADRLHKEYDTEARATSGEGRIDVFGMLVERDIPVIFRPLKNLLGAYIDNPDQGVIVTTQRPLPIQRDLLSRARIRTRRSWAQSQASDEDDISASSTFYH